MRDQTGAITQFDVPQAGTGDGQGTIPHGINTAGEVAGTYTNADGVMHGFVREAEGCETVTP